MLVLGAIVKTKGRQQEKGKLIDIPVMRRKSRITSRDNNQVPKKLAFLGDRISLLILSGAYCNVAVSVLRFALFGRAFRRS